MNPSAPIDPAPHTPHPEFAFPKEGLPWSPGPVHTAPFTPVDTTTVPPAVRFPRQITGLSLPLGKIEIDDDSAVREYIEARLRQMRSTLADEHAVQKVVLELINKARLTTSVFKDLRGLLLESTELTIV